jgi:DNA (cytosine-5)-methyltransferase 1
MNIISLFSGAGGMDMGFRNAGFQTIWANEFDKQIATSFQHYFKDVPLDTRSIKDIPDEDIPKSISGVIGGPPCQSWSQAGSKRGISDPRGQLFMEYLRVIKSTLPKFFVAENVHGLIHKRNHESFSTILSMFDELGYNTNWKLLNASDYQVAQDRKRVIIVGYRKDLNKTFNFPPPIQPKLTLRDAIGDLKNIKIDGKRILYPNHELIESGYSSIFLSRNRVRSWSEQSFTILASERHIPFHPNAPKMEQVGKDKMKLAPGKEHLYRRLTIRECARIQSFPDDYQLIYKNIKAGYKMIGNAVPVNLAYHIAKTIHKDLTDNK